MSFLSSRTTLIVLTLFTALFAARVPVSFTMLIASIVTIVEPHPIRVRFTIPERDVPLLHRHLRPGPRVEIRPGGYDLVLQPERCVEEGSGWRRRLGVALSRVRAA